MFLRGSTWTRVDPLRSCRDIMCGKLFCHNGKDNPNYGRMVRFSDCKASFFDDYTKDYGQVDAGTKCGDGKVTDVFGFLLTVS